MTSHHHRAAHPRSRTFEARHNPSHASAKLDQGKTSEAPESSSGALGAPAAELTTKGEGPHGMGGPRQTGA